MPEPGMGANNDHGVGGGGGLGSDRPDDNDRGGAREDKASFDKAMSDAGNKAGAANDNDPSDTDDGKAGRQSQSYSGPKGVNGPNRSGLNDAARNAHKDASRPSSPNDDGGGTIASVTTPDAPATPETEDDGDRGMLDRSGGFVGGLARDMQDFARANPRVDSHGDVVGLVDADGIQRGEVASGVRSSGTGSEDLARQLGFDSTQDMAAAQDTDFIEDKYQDELNSRVMAAAIEDRYGPVPPDARALLASSGTGIVLASAAKTTADVTLLSRLDDAARIGLKGVTKALGPLGILIDVMTPTPVGDGTLKSEDTTSSDEKVDGVLEGAEPSTPAKKGNTRQYDKPGGLDEANEDFDDMELNDVDDFVDRKEKKPGRYGYLDDGRKVTVRETSDEGRPTLEIEPKQGDRAKTKVRYGD